jgi:hypothetical protein
MLDAFPPNPPLIISKEMLAVTARKA